MSRITRKTTKLSTVELRPPKTPTGGGSAPAVVVLQGAPADIGVHRVIDRPCIIGRGPGVDLPLLDEGLSRRHCVLVPRTGGMVVLQDLQSTNGTLINQRRIHGPTVLADGDYIFIGGTILKFSARESLEWSYHERMNERVGVDDLTGLTARLRFEGALVRAVENCATQGLPLAALMLDLDGIKQINDTHGHEMGAFVIAEAGQVIGRVIAPHGTATRLSGDEFAAFLPRQDRPAAVERAELIVRLVQEHRFIKGEVEVRPTISIGVAVFPDDALTATELLARADDALMRAKRAGRNRVEPGGELE